MLLNLSNSFRFRILEIGREIGEKRREAYKEVSGSGEREALYTMRSVIRLKTKRSKL